MRQTHTHKFALHKQFANDTLIVDFTVYLVDRFASMVGEHDGAQSRW